MKLFFKITLLFVLMLTTVEGLRAQGFSDSRPLELMGHRLSKKYVKQINKRYNRLNRAFQKKMRVYHLLDYVISYQICWNADSLRFANTRAELDAYLLILDQMSALLKEKNLDAETQKKILQAERFREQYSTQIIEAIGIDNIRVKDCGGALIYPEYKFTGNIFGSAAPEIEIKFVLDTKKNTGLASMSIFALESADLAECECLKCLESKYQSCDVAAIEYKKPSVSQRKIRLTMGLYHLLVTQKSGNAEKIIHYEKRKITEADNKKTITLTIDDN